MRSPKARKKARIIAELEALVKRLILARDNYACVRCQRQAPQVILQASHIKTKSRYSRLRFEMLNVLTMCKGCHFWWHHENSDAMEWLERTYPGRIDTLNVLAATATKVDYKELLAGLSLEVKELER